MSAPADGTNGGDATASEREAVANEGEALAFTEPPEPDVYGPERMAPRPVPSEFESADDVQDVNFVPAPCQVACPIGTDAPSYLAYIWEGKTEEAFEAITATNPFSSVCGRVCDAPCEPACRRADSDGPIAIRNLKRFVMDELGASYRPPAVPVTRTETIGIVGGGPAGLTTAQDLSEAGYAVDVYEMTSMLGGYMTWGIPAFRCPREIFEEDIDRMLARCPGITVHLDTELGVDVTLEELKERHDAILLSIGAWWGKGVGLEQPTEDERVIDGVTFLRRVNDGARPTMPARVVVVGAGDVAMDACRVAKRLPGCEHVQVLYRRGEDEIPARLDELEGALKEEVELIYNVQPVAVTGENGDFALRCVRTELGEPEEDGRRWPENVAGSEHEYECGLVILATGQRTESDHLDGLELLHEDKVRTDWASMRTADRKVFAAGDAAFGPSTIVMAMQHGHRAAYYMKSFLEGVEDPLPYRVPFKTRRVPIAQDPEWEVFHREEQDFHGLGANPVQFPEIESKYDLDAARREAARCYRCDAETGSADYSVHAREDIFVMARTQPGDGLKQRATFSKRLRSPIDLQETDLPPSFDDLVFLPANLSRLVIDPYRDACRVNVTLGDAADAGDAGGVVELAAPFIASGFDRAPSEVMTSLSRALAAVGLAYLGQERPDGVPWLQLVAAGDEPSPDAAAIINVSEGDVAALPTRLHAGQLVGITATAAQLRAAIPLALEAELDLLVLDACPSLVEAGSEVGAHPDLTVMRDTIAIMRELNREEDLGLIFRGGVRSGTDGAKLIGLGANVAAVGVALGLAMGGTIEGGELAFYGNVDIDERAEMAELFCRALLSEAAIMPRCTGKTDLRNIEPEDLRAITIATARATGMPLAGAREIAALESAS